LLVQLVLREAVGGHLQDTRSSTTLRRLFREPIENDPRE
jgi:hypothetical protein